MGSICKEKIICRKEAFTPFRLSSPCAEDFPPVRILLRKSSTPRLLLLLPSLQEGRLRGRGLGMHLVLRPVRFPLLPLDLGPARGVEVSLVARPVRASALLSPLLLRELGRRELLVHSGRPLPALLPRLPLPAHHCTLCDVVSRESLRRSAPIRDPPVFPDLRIEEGSWSPLSVGQLSWPVSSIALSLHFPHAVKQSTARFVSVAVIPRAVAACLVAVFGPLSVTFALARCLRKIGRGPRTATGRDRSRRDRSRSSDCYRSRREHSRSPARRSRDHSRSRVRSPLSSDHSRSKDKGRRARREQREGVETVAVSQAPVVSEASATVAPPVVGGAVTVLLIFFESF